jgi:hypothetical protein
VPHCIDRFRRHFSTRHDGRHRQELFESFKAAGGHFWRDPLILSMSLNHALMSVPQDIVEGHSCWPIFDSGHSEVSFQSLRAGYHLKASQALTEAITSGPRMVKSCDRSKMETTLSESRDDHEQAFSHVVAGLAGLSLDSDPCLHGVLQEVFPRAYFVKLIEALPLKWYKAIPSAKAYEDSCQRCLKTSGSRHHLWLAHLLALSDGEERDHCYAFWTGFAQRFATSTFVAALSERCFGEDLSSNIDLSIRFVRETGVAYIPPHLDMPHKLISMICYLGQPGELNKLQGTCLYGTDADGTPIVRKKLPFIANTALVLPRTKESLHGIEPHTPQPDRMTLHFYLQEANKDARGIIRARDINLDRCLPKE